LLADDAINFSFAGSGLCRLSFVFELVSQFSDPPQNGLLFIGTSAFHNSPGRFRRKPKNVSFVRKK
jgi:hypothetical protein